MANNQYNFLDYAGLSLFWNNVKSIIEENELATATALTNLDTRVDNLEASKADKGHTHDYLPLSGGTMINPIKFSYNNNGNCNVSRASGFSMFYSGQSDAENKGFPTQYSSVMSFMTEYCGMQLATYGGNDDRLFFRKISDSDVWTPWYTLLHSGNYTTYCTPTNIGAAPSSHTHTKSQITDFAHTHTKSQITDFAHTHTKSQITDFPTSLPASDVKAWAKADTKPPYTGTEVTLSGYSKNNSYTPIASGDSVQAAIAKLEGALSGLEDLLASI